MISRKIRVIRKMIYFHTVYYLTGIHGNSRKFTEILGNSRKFTEFHGNSRNFTEFHGISRNFTEFHGISQKYTEIHGIWMVNLFYSFPNGFTNHFTEILSTELTKGLACLPDFSFLLVLAFIWFHFLWISVDEKLPLKVRFSKKVTIWFF